jgi:hypothetical protein
MWEAEFRSLIQAARFEALDEDALADWMTTASATDAGWVPRALSRLAEAGQAEARDLIVDRACAGDLESVYELDSAGVLGDTGARQVLATVNASVRSTLDNAERGRWSVGIYNYGAILGWIAVAYPDLADWDLIADLATSAVASAADKSALISTLARKADAIPPETREVLLARRSDLALSAPIDIFGGDSSTAGPALELWIALAEPEEVKRLASEAIAGLLASSKPSDRAEVAQIIFATESHELLPLVESLLVDPSIEVRIAAARLTGSLAGKGSDLVAHLAERILADTGAVVPFHFIGSALASLDGLNRPGFVGGSTPLKAGWSHGRREVTGEADDASLLRHREGPSGPVGSRAAQGTRH